MLLIRENRPRTPLCASRHACGFLELMVAQCAMLGSCLLFDGLLHLAAREHPEIHSLMIEFGLRRCRCAISAKTVCSPSCISSRANYASWMQPTGHQWIENPVCLPRRERNFKRSKFRPERSEVLETPTDTVPVEQRPEQGDQAGADRKIPIQENAQIHQRVLRGDLACEEGHEGQRGNRHRPTDRRRTEPIEFLANESPESATRSR